MKGERRLGNYRVCFVKRSGVPVVEVSNLEKTWMVRIPADYQMYGMLNRLMLDAEDDDNAVSERASDWLYMYFVNWQNATGIPCGHFQKAIVMLSAAYADPSLLKTSIFGSNKFLREADALRKEFLDWAKDRDGLLKRFEKETENDGLADEVRGIVESEEEKQEGEDG